MPALQIDVTWKHIRSGTKGEMDQCPICLAIRQHYPNKAVNVSFAFPGGGAIAYIDHREYILNEACRKFMVDYDNGEAVLPFSFYLVRKR